MKNLLRQLFVPFLLLISLPNLLYAQDEDVMFQAFDWNVQDQPAGTTWYSVVSGVSDELSTAGFDMVWLPPSSNSAAPQGYLPRELNNFNSAYGSARELRSLISDFKRKGMRAIGDIVINHRVGSADAVNFTNPTWPTFFITADDEGNEFINPPVEFSINSDYFPGRSLKADNSSGGFAAARDLDHKNPAVRDEIVKYMLRLKNDIGFDGWRYDFVHGYDPIYNKEYNDRTAPYFAVAELLERDRTQLNNFINFSQGASSVFDFDTKVDLGDAIRFNNFGGLRDFAGNAGGLLGINPTKTVTFLDNHDTGEAQQCCGSGFIFPTNPTDLRKGYAYILTHPGVPMVFWTHYFDQSESFRSSIKSMIALRKDIRIFSGSKLSIDRAEDGLYAAYIDGRNGTLAMKIGNRNWAPNGSGWTLRLSGTDYAIWSQGGGTSPNPPVAPFDVHFRKPSNWGNDSHVYLFNKADNSRLSGTPAWPGSTMTRLNNSDWYVFNANIPIGVGAADIGVIFNDGDGQQTVDLNRSSEGWFNIDGASDGKATGTWIGDCPFDCPDDEPGSGITLNVRLPTSNWSNTTNVYLFDRTTNTKWPGTSDWPGTRMDRLNNSPWFSFTLALSNERDARNLGVVFNDGNGQQTTDLSRASDGWFTINSSGSSPRGGTWSNTCTGNCPTLGNRHSEEEPSAINTSLIYPNPFVTEVRLDLSIVQGEVLQIGIYDTSGNTIFQDNTSAHKGEREITLSGKSGVYILKVKTTEKVYYQKLIRRNK